MSKTTSTFGRARTARRGSTLLYVMVAMVALFGFLSLAVDYGRVQVVKTELQRAVDAGARYGAVGLKTSNTLAASNARVACMENGADDYSPVIPTVVTGNWNEAAGKFTGNASPGNAIRVSASREVPLLFAQLIGKPTITVTASAVGRADGNPPNFIGLNGIYIKNNSSMGYKSANGNPGGGNSDNTFRMASNGDITISNNGQFKGQLILGPGAKYSGSGTTPPQIKLADPLSFPPTENPPFTPTTGLNVTGTMHIVGGGTKAYTYITLDNGASLVFDAPTTVYVTGNVSFVQDGTIVPASGIPGDLKIRMTGGPTAVFGGANANNLTVIGEVYAPDADFSAKNNADMAGSFLFRTITVKNNLNVAYDESSESVADGVPGAWTKPGLVQ